NLDEIVGHCVAGNREIAHRAMEVASEAYKQSSIRSRKERAAILNRAADLLEQRASLFHALAVREAGKSWTDAVAEVREAVDFCRYYASQSIKAEFEKRQSLGVIVCISPWNFPLAIFLGQITAALAAGNTVVAKPAEQTPLIATEAIRLLHDAGIAPAEVNLVPGDGPNVGTALIAHPAVAAICFTGSTRTAKHIARRLAELGRPAIPLIAETGGINAMIVDSTALLEQTVDDIISSAFQSAGQRCSALRLLCVQEDVADELIKILRGAMEALRIGDPSRIDTDVGPVIDLAALKNIETNTQRLDQTAKLICALEKPSDNGNFIAPCAYEVRNIGEVEQEIFGPVLHVVRFAARDKQNVIDQINNLGYGLTLGIQSRIDGTSDKMARNANAGNIYINRNQIGAVVGVQPFGGHGLSGTGPKAGGPLYLYRLSKSKLPSASRTILPDLPYNDHWKGSSIVTKFENLPNKFVTAKNAARKWDMNPDRENIFETLFDKCGIEDRVTETASWKQLNRWAGELASPTGETNIYLFRGRGVILSVLKDHAEIMKACMKSILTGNSFIHISAEASPKNLKVIQKTIAEYSGLSDLIQFHCVAKNSQILNIIKTCLFDALIVDGLASFAQDAGRALVLREGPILPIISPFDGLDRYIHEQTITRNIAAAGGNIALLNT
ncbi:Proline dehydrogenase / Delta-1-pyrroline-5-carboxylate dehydrogenase, partial [hydrothermal vent metagenome]